MPIAGEARKALLRPQSEQIGDSYARDDDQASRPAINASVESRTAGVIVLRLKPTEMLAPTRAALFPTP